MEAGDLLAEIIDPYEGFIRARVTAPGAGVIFFAQQNPLVMEHAILFKLLPQ